MYTCVCCLVTIFLVPLIEQKFEHLTCMFEHCCTDIYGCCGVREHVSRTLLREHSFGADRNMCVRVYRLQLPCTPVYMFICFDVLMYSQAFQDCLCLLFCHFGSFRLAGRDF